MTIIRPQPAQKKLNIALTLATVSLVGVSIWLVVIYNRVVNTEHTTVQMESELRTIQTATAELKEKTFSLFSGNEADALAVSRGLLKEKSPAYFEVAPGALIASRGTQE